MLHIILLYCNSNESIPKPENKTGAEIGLNYNSKESFKLNYVAMDVDKSLDGTIFLC